MRKLWMKWATVRFARRHLRALERISESLDSQAIGSSQQLTLEPASFEDGLEVLSRYPARRAWFQIGKPWITNPSIEFLEDLLSQQDSVLEYGLGRSTPWFAERTSSVVTVEASPEWTAAMLLYLYSRPSTLKRVRIYWCPAEWNPDASRMQPYWDKRKSSLMPRDVDALERDFLSANFPRRNVLFLDGSIRPLVLTRWGISPNLKHIDVIVVDNTESAKTLLMGRRLFSNEFVEFSFPETVASDIPKHQNGRHMTTVFVRHRRVQRLGLDSGGTRPSKESGYEPETDSTSVDASIGALAQRLVKLGIEDSETVLSELVRLGIVIPESQFNE